MVYWLRLDMEAMVTALLLPTISKQGKGLRKHYE
jgi:hypothetical protein